MHACMHVLNVVDHLSVGNFGAFIFFIVCSPLLKFGSAFIPKVCVYAYYSITRHVIVFLQIHVCVCVHRLSLALSLAHTTYTAQEYMYYEQTRMHAAPQEISNAHLPSKRV